MKRLFIIAALLLFTTISAQAQWKSYPSIVTAGDSLGSEITLKSNEYIFGVVTPALTEGTTSMKFDVSGQQNNAVFKPLWYSGSAYSITIDSTGTASTLNPQAFSAWQKMRPVLPVTQEHTDTLYFQALKLQ